MFFSKKNRWEKNLKSEKSGHKMDSKKYMESIFPIIREVISISGINLDDPNTEEETYQIMASFCFGVVNAHAIENNITQPQVHAAIIGMLTNDFYYNLDVATQYSEFLIKCSNKDFRPAVNAIIHRGIDGYFRLKEGKRAELKENIDDIFWAYNFYKK